MSYLLNGVVEQNYIAHVMAYSACIGPYDLESCRARGSAGSTLNPPQTSGNVNTTPVAASTTKSGSTSLHAVSSFILAISLIAALAVYH
jgi:hypothetical protein